MDTTAAAAATDYLKNVQIKKRKENVVCFVKTFGSERSEECFTTVFIFVSAGNDGREKTTNTDIFTLHCNRKR